MTWQVGGVPAVSQQQAALCLVSSLLMNPKLGAPASLPARRRDVDPETRRQGSRRSQSGDQFIALMRDLGIVETPHNPSFCWPFRAEFSLLAVSAN